MRCGVLLIAYQAELRQQWNGFGMLLKVGIGPLFATLSIVVEGRAALTNVPCFFRQQRRGRRILSDVRHFDRMTLYP